MNTAPLLAHVGGTGWDEILLLIAPLVIAPIMLVVSSRWRTDYDDEPDPDEPHPDEPKADEPGKDTEL